MERDSGSMEYRLLEQVNCPRDLKKLSERELFELCAEIRAFFLAAVSKTGGQLASNLGAVELTVAIHRVFDLPEDKLVFDVGHQCYTHKLLTGRREQFCSLRSFEGISGFPKPWESPYDAFVAGHASTSVSAAFGIASALTLQGSPHYALALIGDGAMTGGMAYEALNNAGRSRTRLVVILNHNDMSISKNVGAFARYLSSIRSRPFYLGFKRRVKRFLTRLPLLGKPLLHWLEHSKSLLKSILYPSTFFEDMGFEYLGPVDGHDLPELIRTLALARDMAAPVVVQVETVKGKGYPFAEENPGAYHAIGNFDVRNGGDDVTMADCYSNQIGQELVRLGEKEPRICAVTAAMKYGTGLHTFAAAHRDRFFDVGIAEEHAVTFAGGLSAQGLLPVFCVYSTFLQRGFDQAIHDLAIDGKRAVLCVDRAGIVGEDGETHQGVFDAAFLSEIPGVTVYSPEGYEEARLCLRHAVLEDRGLSCVRYPRGGERRSHSLPPSTDFQFIDRSGRGLLISYGRSFSGCWQAAEALERESGERVSLLKLTRITPLDPRLPELVSRFEQVLFVEEGIRAGGIGEHLAALLLEQGFRGSFRIAAIEGRFVPQGRLEELLEQLRLDPASIQERMHHMLKGGAAHA